MSEPTLRIGKEKIETPVSEVGDDQLEWYANECRNPTLREIAKREIERRNGGPGPDDAPRGQSTALARTEVHEAILEVSGTYRSAERATMALQQVQEFGHLIAPAPAIGAIPEGCALALSGVLIDVEKETYELQGKRGLNKVALRKIAAAAGISWDPRQSRRLDDRSDPHYCHYIAVARVRDYDGTIRELTGELEIDAREGSAEIARIRRNAARRAEREKRSNDGGDAQIEELRTFLLRHAESKAKNRVVRELGLQTSYDRKELEKPFICAKIQFTGQTDDPVLKPIFAKSIADSFTNANQALYGGAPALPPAAQVDDEDRHAPPPVGTVRATDSARDDEDDVPPSSRPSSPPPRPRAQQQTLGEKF